MLENDRLNLKFTCIACNTVAGSTKKKNDSSRKNLLNSLLHSASKETLPVARSVSSYGIGLRSL
jgi:hypothetical protein